MCYQHTQTTERFGSYQDPFEDYKTRLTKKLAKLADAEQQSNGLNRPPDKKDDINWFGLKVGTEKAAFGGEQKAEGGVGKYLMAARPSATEGTERPTKRRKTGFGDFEGW